MLSPRNNFIFFVFVTLLVMTQKCGCQESSKLVLVIISQPEENHTAAAKLLSEKIISEALHFDINVVVLLSAEVWPDVASWAYFPLLERVEISAVTSISSYGSWIIILEEWSVVNLPLLEKVLSKYNSCEPVFLGRGVYDEMPTILHHFERVDLKDPFIFPDSRAGFGISGSLYNLLKDKWLLSKLNPMIDFTIDAAYEFARFVRKAGVLMKHHNDFCVEKNINCVISYHPRKHCGSSVAVSKVHFAIKTCNKFHNERLQVVKDTWQKDAHSYTFYSDVHDDAWGTKSLGVANTEQGHCAKTIAIIKEFALNHRSLLWLAVVDDDTLISIPRLLMLLSCYKSTELVALGERYGYHSTTKHGYEYITGGGGIIISMELVNVIVKECECPSDDAPDDMILGMCLHHLGIPIIHSREFHQARPDDYPRGLLQSANPVSFHKHWMIDPLKVYRNWLLDENPSHTEL